MNRALTAAAVWLVSVGCERDPRTRNSDTAEEIVVPAIGRGGAPTPKGTILRLTPTSVELGGRHIVHRAHPLVWASLVDVVQIEPVTRAVKNVSPPPTVLMVEADRNTPFTVVASLLWSSARAGVTDVRIIVTQGGHPATIKLSADKYKGGLPRQLPVRPVVQIENDSLVLYSFSGLAGIVGAPLATIAREPAGLAHLTRTLYEVAVRHYGAPPVPQNDVVFVIPNRSASLLEVVDVMTAIVTSDDAQPLFPTIAVAFLR